MTWVSLEASITVRPSSIEVHCEPGGDNNRSTISTAGDFFADEDRLFQALGQAVMFALDCNCEAVHVRFESVDD